LYTLAEGIMTSVRSLQRSKGDMQAAKRDWIAPPTHDLNIWLCGR